MTRVTSACCKNNQKCYTFSDNVSPENIISKFVIINPMLMPILWSSCKTVKLSNIVIS